MNAQEPNSWLFYTWAARRHNWGKRAHCRIKLYAVPTAAPVPHNCLTPKTCVQGALLGSRWSFPQPCPVCRSCVPPQTAETWNHNDRSRKSYGTGKTEHNNRSEVVQERKKKRWLAENVTTLWLVKTKETISYCQNNTVNPFTAMMSLENDP